MTVLARMSGVALWRQIEQAIESDIRLKTFGPGDRLPTEAELSSRFGVNRHTVRRAIAGLQERGVVRVEQGRGSFVQENVVDYRLGRRTRFSENVFNLRREPGTELLRMQRLRADKTVAQMLDLRVGDPVIALETRRSVDGRPLNIGTHHFPLRRFPTLGEAYKAERSITGALRRLGVADYTRKTTRVTARLPDGDEARLLMQPRNHPVLVTESVNVDEADRPIEYGVARFAAERVQFVFET